MKKAILTASVLMLALAFPSISWAGESNHDNHEKMHGHGKKHVGYAHMILSKAEKLDLTTKQLGLITRIHLQHKKARKELTKKLHKSMATIHKGLRDPATKDNIIREAAKKHTETINELMENALTERKRVNSVLTEAQRKKIISMKKMHEHEHEHKHTKEKSETEMGTEKMKKKAREEEESSMRSGY